MKNFNNQLKYIFILVFVSFLTSCSDGEDGATGLQGPAGQDGNANVISVLFEKQTINNGNNTFDVPQLTQEIYDTGFVYGYVTVTGNEYWETLPISARGTGEIILEIDRIEVGKITLRADFTQSNLKLRFVLVSSTTATQARLIDNFSYTEAMDYFNLKD